MEARRILCTVMLLIGSVFAEWGVEGSSGSTVFLVENDGSTYITTPPVTSIPDTLTGKVNGKVVGFSSSLLTSGSEPVSWFDIINKPTDFPPESHTQDISTINDLQNVLNNKAALIHTHGISDVDSLQTTLDSKEPAISTSTSDKFWNGLKQWVNITIGNVLGLNDTITNHRTAIASKLNISDTSSLARKNHVHAIADVTSLQTTLDGKLDKRGVSITSFDNTGPNTVGITIFSSGWNKPDQPSGASYWSGFEFRHNIVEDYRSQIAMGTTGITPQLAIRNKTNGVWGSWYKVWHDGNFDPADYQSAITGTAYKVLSIQSDGSGVKTGCLRDLGNYAAIDNAERFAIIHSTDQAAISLQSQNSSRFWISSAIGVLNIGGAGTTAPENGQLQIYYNSRVAIPSLPLLVGKATATTGNPYKIEVEGNALVNGTLEANSFVGQYESEAKHYHDVLAYVNPASSITGIMKIVMPKTWSETMMTITIKGYTYTDNDINGWECRISGYNSIGAWYRHSATIIGNAPFNSVRLGHDGSRCVIILGETTTSWRFQKIIISDLVVGHSTTDGWDTGWSASIITSEDGITNIVTPTTSIYGNNATIPNTALIGKTTATGGYGLEVEGNTLVNGTLKANDFGDDWVDVSNSIIVPNVTIAELMVLIKKEGKRVTILFTIAGTANNSIPFVSIVGIPTGVNKYILGYDSRPSFTSVTKKGVVVCISADGMDFMRILKSYGGVGESPTIFEEGSITYYTD